MSTTTPPNVGQFNPLTSPDIQEFQNYLPTAFSDQLTLLQKVNYLLQYMQTVTTSFNNIGTTWTDVVNWVEGDGLTNAVDNQMNTWNNDGTLSNIINVQMIGTLANLLTVDKDNLVDAINDNYNTIVGLTDSIVYASLPPYNISANGQDQSAVLQQIFNDLKSNPRRTVILPTGNYICNASLTAYAGGGTLNLNGSSIDFTGLTSGYAISIVPTTDDTYNSSVPLMINGVISKTVNESQNTDGIYIGRPTSISSGNTAGVSLHHVDVMGFRDNLYLDDQTWLNTFVKCRFGTAWQNNINAPLGTTAGENIQFIGCVIMNAHSSTNNANGLNLPNGGNADLHFIACSFDYNDVEATINSGIVDFVGCHMEDKSNNPMIYVTYTGGQGNIVLNFMGGTLSPTGSPTRDHLIESVGDNITYNFNALNVQTYGYNYEVLRVVSGSPFVYSKGIQLQTQTGANTPILSKYSNLLRNGDFETNSLTGWTQNAGGTIYSVQSSTVNSGSYALEVNCSTALSGASSLVQSSIPVFAGEQMQASVWYNSSLTSGTANLQVLFLDQSGATISTHTLASVSGTNGWTHAGDWMRVPSGAVTCSVQVSLPNGLTGLMYVDDYIVNRV